jgi:hypothetical protein
VISFRQTPGNCLTSVGRIEKKSSLLQSVQFVSEVLTSSTISPPSKRSMKQVPPNRRFGQDFRTSCQIKGVATMVRAATSLRKGSLSLGMRACSCLIVSLVRLFQSHKVQIWGEPVPHDNTSEFRLLGLCGRQMLAARFSPRDPNVWTGCISQLRTCGIALPLDRGGCLSRRIFFSQSVTRSLPAAAHFFDAARKAAASNWPLCDHSLTPYRFEFPTQLNRELNSAHQGIRSLELCRIAR